MPSSVLLTRGQKRLQLQLIWTGLFLLALLYCLSYWITAAAYFFVGVTAQASVTNVEDVYSPEADHVVQRRVHYQFFDKDDRITRTGSYLLDAHALFPGIGQQFPVEYLRGHADSAQRAGENPAEPMCATIPVLILWGIGILSMRRGEWGPLPQSYCAASISQTSRK